MIKPLSVIFLILLSFSCKRKIEIKEVEIEKKFSWTEIERFTGTQKVILSSGSSTDAIYLQQPFYFSELRNTDPANGITVYGAILPSDVHLRIPISPRFYAYPYNFNDTAIRIVNNQRSVTSPTGGYYNIRELDPTATRINSSFLDLLKCMAVNKNDVLLFSYQNNRPGYPFTFYLFAVKTLVDYPYIDTFYTKQVTIPKTTLSGYIRHLAAIDDYFIVELSSDGIYKIKEDGSFTKAHSYATVDAFYEWNGKVYGHAEWDKLLISSDKGQSFQEFSGLPSFMTLSQYFKIKDSLIGAYHDNLYTLRFSGNNYTVRAIKNDGLEGTTINGIEILKDSVYVATTSGLFVKPLTSFFEGK